VLLSRPPRLPREIAFPGHKRGRALLGRRYTGATLAVPWPRLGHLLVAGKTRSGKSNFLRLLVHQALADGHQLFLADLNNTTFPMLAEHPALLAPVATDASGMLEIVERGLGECEHREALYDQAPGFPEKWSEYNQIAAEEGLVPLPRILVVLDEFNAAVLAAGGSKGPLATAVAELGWQGIKFGIDVVFAAQDFAKDTVGRIRDQLGAAVCFRVRSQAVARHVGCPDATRIPESRPGLAVTDRWGPVQTFLLDKQHLIAQGQRKSGIVFDGEERELIRRALTESEGRMSIPLLVDWGMTEKPARKLLEEWEARGWVEKDPERYNARYITEKLRKTVLRSV
jgi:DNA segregation ATPase FtsK/SpoIIIE-like protein